MGPVPPGSVRVRRVVSAVVTADGWPVRRGLLLETDRDGAVLALPGSVPRDRLLTVVLDDGETATTRAARAVTMGRRGAVGVRWTPGDGYAPGA